MSYVENGVSRKKWICSREKRNILLIGDSIRMGYCQMVKNQLAQQAQVLFPEDNCRSSQYLIFSLNGWRNQVDAPELVDLVIFNCGHWDIAHWTGLEESLTSPEEYRKNIRMIITQLRKLFVNARVIFVTTTPMNPSGLLGINPRTSEEIDDYNAVAAEVCQAQAVPVIDLNGFCRSWGSEYYRDYCHFTPEGFARLGEEMSRRIGDYL